MKKLSTVSLEDAKEIIKSGYPTFFHTDNWKIRNDSEELGEQCMCLYSRYKAFDFTFYDDKISIHSTGSQDIFISPWDSSNFDIILECYVAAYNLGYHIPQFDKLKTLRVA